MTRRNFMQKPGRDERGQMERVVNVRMYNGETGETRPLADNTGPCRQTASSAGGKVVGLPY